MLSLSAVLVYSYFFLHLFIAYFQEITAAAKFWLFIHTAICQKLAGLPFMSTAFPSSLACQGATPHATISPPAPLNNDLHIFGDTMYLDDVYKLQKRCWNFYPFLSAWAGWSRRHTRRTCCFSQWHTNVKTNEYRLFFVMCFYIRTQSLSHNSYKSFLVWVWPQKYIYI